MSFWFISTASDETGKSKSPSPPPSKTTKSITRGQRAAATCGRGVLNFVR